MTENKARKVVNKNTDSITKIIDVSDLIHQDVNSWENVDIELLKQELHDSIGEWSFQATHPYESLIQELAVSYYIESMQRVPYDHLVFDSRDKCVIEGYWLYDMNKTEIVDMVNENKDNIEYFQEYVQESQMFIESCVIDKQVKELE